MAITVTTLSGAITSSATQFSVASATGIAAPNFQTGSGITVLFIDQEYMLVMAVSGTLISVVRGWASTASTAHVSGEQVQIGLLSDFAKFQEILQDEMVKSLTVGNRNQQAIFLTGTADAVNPATPGYYVIKTSSGVDAVTLITPTAAMEGNVIEIWSDSAEAHTITAASTNFAVGAAANKTVCTFPAHPGVGIALRVCNLNYHLMYTSGTGTNSGPVVWT